MTPEAQQIAIAQACGWKIVHRTDHTGIKWSELLDSSGHQVDLLSLHAEWENVVRQLPDYLNDLNAMHAAWLTLSVEEKRLFQICLLGVMCRHNQAQDRTTPEWELLGATAEQWAEAFLRTKGLWES